MTTNDLREYIKSLLHDPSIGTIVLNAAVCDYDAEPINGIPNGLHANRLRTDEGCLNLRISPAAKLISEIRKIRPDIFLVGFKTTTNKSPEVQYATALKSMKSSKCNLVLANDTVTRNNMIIVPEEAMYNETKDRLSVLTRLARFISARSNLTWNNTTLYKTDNVDMHDLPDTFQTVLSFLVSNGAFICDNGNNFTPGHFCYKVNKNEFISSTRKTDHNNALIDGMVRVKTYNNKVFAYGNKKPSVGATSQRLLFDKYPEYDCIVHTHNVLNLDNKIILNGIAQAPFQCGSLECGQNTAEGMREYTLPNESKVMAIFLHKHGPVYMFKSPDEPKHIIDFINDTVDVKTKIGYSKS